MSTPRRVFVLFVLLGVFVTGLFPSASASGNRAAGHPGPSSSGEIPDRVPQDLLDWAVERGIPGAVMGVATPQGTWFGTAGVANIRTFEPMFPRHGIRLARITKTFTATLIWSLIESRHFSPDGRRFRLTDTIDKWLEPGLVPNSDKITVSMLLNHTSGLYDHENSPEFVEKLLLDPSHEWSAEEVWSITRAHGVSFEPGEGFEYCNTGYYLLGMIAEAATGEEIEKLVKSRLFRKAEMLHSKLSRSGNLPVLRTPGYTWLEGYDRPVSTLRWNFSYDWTAGSGVSTASDMLAWAGALSGGKILKPDTLKRAWTIKKPSRKGYGFAVTKSLFGDRRIGHPGENPGTTNDLIFYPDKGWALFIGLNFSDKRPSPDPNNLLIMLALRNAAEAVMGWKVHVD